MTKFDEVPREYDCVKCGGCKFPRITYVNEVQARQDTEWLELSCSICRYKFGWAECLGNPKLRAVVGPPPR